MSQYVRLTGQVRVELNGSPLLTASRISMRIAKPISKQKSATMVGIAEGIPDPSGNIKLMPDASGRGVTPQDLVLMEGGGTLVFIVGAQRWQIAGATFTDASLDNDPGAASLDNSVGFEGATVKRIA